MKTLQNHIILYDAECPMCNLYTKAFVSAGILDDTGRTAYQDTPEMLCPLIDRQRAVNEIALVNTQTGEVKYGIESLFKVIGNSFPMFKGLFSFGPFVWLAAKCYAFISYNRRVIIPANNHDYAIQPSFSLKLRLAYLMFTWLIVGAVLTQYAALLTPLITDGNCLPRIPYLRRTDIISRADCKLVRCRQKVGLSGQHDDHLFRGCAGFIASGNCSTVYCHTRYNMHTLLFGGSRADVFRTHPPNKIA
ncbi:hypothetical protein [Mucilaginibacter defluvii]|uniref:hypothetical protein n=1 Tax=Mucilaginibacter defluvii TaxID=1196019 RepID=UPI0031E561ED